VPKDVQIGISAGKGNGATGLFTFTWKITNKPTRLFVSWNQTWLARNKMKEFHYFSALIVDK